MMHAIKVVHGVALVDVKEIVKEVAITDAGEVVKGVAKIVAKTHVEIRVRVTVEAVALFLVN